MALQLKAFLLPPEAFHVKKHGKTHHQKAGNKTPAHCRAEEPCISLSHFLAYSTLRDVKELVFALVNNNNEHDIYGGVWPKACWDYSSMPTFI